MRNYVPRYWLSLLLLTCLITLPACDSGDANDEDDDGGSNDSSTFVTLSQPVEAKMTGDATFQTVLGISTAITIILDNRAGNVVLTSVGPVTEGIHSINQTTEGGIFAIQITLTNGEVVDSATLIEGRVQIKHRDDKRIQGLFEGGGTLLDSGLAIVALGAFDARCLLCN